LCPPNIIVLIQTEKDQRSRAAGMRAVDEKYKHSFIWTPQEMRPLEKHGF
jgi:hypothetical protein